METVTVSESKSMETVTVSESKSLDISHEEPKSRSSSGSSSSEEAGQIKHSSSEVTASDTTESSRPKDSSATESSQQQPGIRQDTLEEIDEESSAVNGAKQPPFQIQHATEQEVDDFYQVQPTATASEGDESTAEIKMQ